MASSNTPRMGETQRMRLRLFPRNAAGALVYQPGSTSVAIDLSDQLVTAEVTEGADYAELRNADGTRLAPGGVVAPNRYGEVWLVGKSVRQQQQVRVKMTVSGSKTIAGGVSASKLLLVDDTVPDPVEVDPDLDPIAAVDISVSGPANVPDGWLR